MGANNEFISFEDDFNEEQEYVESIYEESDEYDDTDDELWGQERGLCDCADNCYGCPYASRCF